MVVRQTRLSPAQQRADSFQGRAEIARQLQTGRNTAGVALTGSRNLVDSDTRQLRQDVLAGRRGAIERAMQRFTQPAVQQAAMTGRDADIAAIRQRNLKRILKNQLAATGGGVGLNPAIVARAQRVIGGGGAAGLANSIGGPAGALLQAQLAERDRDRGETLRRIDALNAQLQGQVGSLGEDPLQQRAREAALAAFEGSGPEALNEAASRINAASNARAQAGRFAAMETGQLGGSGGQAISDQIERERIAGLGQVASEAAQRRFAEQQQALAAASGLAGREASHRLRTINSQLIPNLQSMDLSGVGGLLAGQMQASALAGGLGAIGAGIGALGAQQQMGTAALPQAQAAGPGAGFDPRVPLPQAAITAIAQGRNPVMMDNADPRLAALTAQMNSRMGGGVNAQDSLLFQQLQRARGFGPDEMEATQRVDNPLAAANRPFFAVPGGHGGMRRPSPQDAPPQPPVKPSAQRAGAAGALPPGFRRNNYGGLTTPNGRFIPPADMARQRQLINAATKKSSVKSAFGSGR